MQSPCINICYINDDSRLCEGCGRTVDEISSWMTFTDQQRKSIMATLPKRLRTIDKNTTQDPATQELEPSPSSMATPPMAN